MYYEAEEDQEKQDKEQPTKVPIEFSDEEAGPPNVDPAFLQRLDDEATEKKIRRLTKMDVISLVSTDPQEATGSVPCANSAQEVYKWLTTKLVKEWRRREAAGFEAEATEGTKKKSSFSSATSPGITNLVPMALANTGKMPFYRFHREHLVCPS